VPGEPLATVVQTMATVDSNGLGTVALVDDATAGVKTFAGRILVTAASTAVTVTDVRGEANTFGLTSVEVADDANWTNLKEYSKL